MKSLKLIDRLRMIYNGIYAKKHGSKSVKDVAKSFGLARPSYYVYRREVLGMLEKIGFDEESFYQFIKENGDQGYNELIEKIIAHTEKKKKINRTIEVKDDVENTENVSDKEPEPKPVTSSLVNKIKSKLNETVYNPSPTTPFNIENDTQPTPRPQSEPTNIKPTQINWNMMIWVGGLLLVGVIIYIIMKKKKDKEKAEHLEPKHQIEIPKHKIPENVYPFF